MNSVNNTNGKDRSFVSSKSATRYLPDGRSERCHYSHSIHDHKQGYRAEWYDSIYNKKVTPACIGNNGSCRCEFFQPYRTASLMEVEG